MSNFEIKQAEKSYLPTPPFTMTNVDGESVDVVVVAPGYEKEDISITVQGGKIVVRAERKEGIVENLYAQGFELVLNKREKDHKRFLDMSGDNATITYENGILTISVTIPEDRKPVALEIS